MNCFIRFIESREDRAIRGDFGAETFRPFTLLALSGFDVQPNRAQVHLISELLIELGGRSSPVLVCRNTQEAVETFDQTAVRGFRRLEDDDLKVMSGSWRHNYFYVVDSHKSEILQDVILNYWRTWYGNWMFAEFPENPDHANAVRNILQQPETQIARTRARFLEFAKYAALTFDDNLLDIFVDRSLEAVATMVKRLSKVAHVSITFTDH